MSGASVEAPTSSQLPSLSLIVPLVVELHCLSSASSSPSGARISVLQSGQGAARARHAAHAALAKGATALMSIGVAGALVADLEAGDVVVPDRIVDAASGATVECTTGWAVSVRRRLAGAGRLSDGVLLSVPHVLTTPADKRTAAEQFDAVACDMESAAIGAVAAQFGIPFLALRVVCDISTDVLPANVERFVDDAGKTRLLPIIGTLMAPGSWGSIMTMNSRFRLAQRRLNELSDTLAPSAYCCPGQ